MNLSSKDESNFHVHVRVTEGLSSIVPPPMPVNARIEDNETLPSLPPFTYDRLLEREGESSRSEV
jgi:hypothetical protein